MLLLYSACPTLSTTYSILLCIISDSSWLSVYQASRAEMLLAEIRNWKEEEEEEAVEGDLS